MHEADNESGIKTSKSTGKSNQSSLYTTHSKSAGGNHRSVMFRPVSHHSSVVFRNEKSVAHHSDDSVGLFRQTHQSPCHNVALISGHQSINLAQYACMNAKKFISDFHMHNICKQRIQFSNSGSSHNSQDSHKPDSRLRYSQVMLEAVKSRSILASTTEFYLNRFLQRHGATTEATQPLPAFENPSRYLLRTQICHRASHISLILVQI
ncbi:sucrose synthase 2-like [Dorcoceras hygrometricum]|uniref:Sucrose synthase 2-like n=1 Tax=Dorcoceras hygrometricum TaxID=472368 RepID=A0A2Z7AI92_9LAMI|nr:sucrose synthase 2-like [Dorcoceras hygrometricum]